MKKVNIIIPFLNEEKNLPNLLNALESIIKTRKEIFTVIFINDGSTDDGLDFLEKYHTKYFNISLIDFSRNFGKENAIKAGLDSSYSADAVIIMDSDLQHPPEMINILMKYYYLGYDQVIARRNRSGDPIIKKVLSKLYYKLSEYIMEVDIQDGEGDFRLISKKVVSEYNKLEEYQRFSKGLFSWIGFKKITVSYDNVIRDKGKSKFSLKMLTNYAIDSILSFNSKPLRILMPISMLLLFLSIIYIIYIFITSIFYGITTPGYFTIIASLLFFSSIQMLSISVLGEYLGKIYMEVKSRPSYIINEKSECIDD